MEEEVITTENIEEVENVINEVDYKDKYLRALADYDNLLKQSRKRTEDEKTNVRNKILTNFIEIVDDFERALAHEQNEGLRLIYNRFIGVLTNYGCEVFGNVGDTFDSDLHNAISMMECGEDNVNKIVACSKKGYKINDNVVRYAEVVIGC